MPSFIYDYLSPLAYWIMDDGNKDGNSLIISTQSFNLQDINLLRKVLYDKYGFITHARKQREKKQLSK